MKVAIATGRFHGFTNDDFAYLQKANAAGEKLIIIVGYSDVQNQVVEHLKYCKMSEYVIPELPNDTEGYYTYALARLVGYRETSPNDNIELVYVANPDEIDETLKLFCEQNGVSYIS